MTLPLESVSQPDSQLEFHDANESFCSDLEDSDDSQEPKNNSAEEKEDLLDL